MATITGSTGEEPFRAGPGDSPGPETGRRQEEQAVGALLARAKLLRVRGQWDAATSLCTEAMRRYPESLTARSLLGEIYEAQNRLDDAAQWYAMALDISPDSHKDRAALDRVLALGRATRETEASRQAALLRDVPVHRPRRRERTLEWWDKTFPPGRSEGIARMILAASGVITLLLVVSAGAMWWLLRTGRGPFANRAAQVAAREAPADTLPAPTLSPLPVVVQPPAHPVARPSAAPATPTPAPSAAVARVAAEPVITPEMKALAAENASFASDLASQVGIAFRVVTVQRDPVTRQVAVLIALPPLSESVENSRERVVRAATRTARIAAQLDGKLQSATLTVGIPSPTPTEMTAGTGLADLPAGSTGGYGNAPVFIGDISLAPLRQAPLDIADTASVADLLMRFRRSQWSDALNAPAN